MSRRNAIQVPHTLSRLLKGGALKSPPASYQALLSNAPIQAPPRSPYPRSSGDLPPYLQRQLDESDANENRLRRRDRSNSKKKVRTRTPSLKPQPIIYLEDKVRRQFYADHPWEGLRPRTVVENEKVEAKQQPPQEVTDLTWWSTNPQPEDVIDFSVHLHRSHSLPLIDAYKHALSQYHALRAEHETASRYAVLEAQAYGGQFGSSSVVQDNFGERLGGGLPLFAAPETMRGFSKEQAALTKESQDLERQQLLAAGVSSTEQARSSFRVKPIIRSDSFSGGANYRQGAAAIVAGNLDAFNNSRRAAAIASGASSPSRLPETAAADREDPFQLREAFHQRAEAAAAGPAQRSQSRQGQASQPQPQQQQQQQQQRDGGNDILERLMSNRATNKQ